MKFTFLLISFGYIVTAIPSPSLPVHPGVGGLYKGPNSEIIIKGPDGSVITAAAEGGEVRIKLEPIVVEEPAVVAEVQPVIAEVEPIVTDVKPIVAETIEVAAEPAKPSQNAEITGPSGLIATNGVHSIIAGPASTTITGPAVVAETVVKGTPVIGVASPHLPVASASISPELTVASASITSHGSVATATATPNIAIAAAGDSEQIVIAKANIAPAYPNIQPLVPPVTALPILASTLSPTNLVEPNIGVVHEHNLQLHGIEGINDHIDFDANIARTSEILPKTHGQFHGLRLNPDQFFSHNKQILLNPNLIPSQNIIPPEISFRPIAEANVDGKLLSFESPVHAESGISNVPIAPSSNIQRIEAEPAAPNYVTVTENISPVSVQSVSTITPNIQREEAINEQVLSSEDINAGHQQQELDEQNQVFLQNRHQQNFFQPAQLINVTPKSKTTYDANALPVPEALSGTVQQSVAPISTAEVYPNSYSNLPQGLSQSGNFLQSGVLPQTGHFVESGAISQSSGLLQSGNLAQSSIIPHSGIQSSGFSQSANFPQSAIVSESANLNKEQPILSAALAKTGISLSQINLANVPLSAVSPLASPVNLGKLSDGWGRYGREVKDEKVAQKL